MDKSCGPPFSFSPGMGAASPTSAIFLVWLMLIFTGAPSCSPGSDASIEVFGAPDSHRLRQVVAGLKAGLEPRPLHVFGLAHSWTKAPEELRRIRRRRPPLLIVLGTSALLEVAPMEKRIPVVFAMVANPFFTGAASDSQHPEIHQGNITGIASPPPVAAALEQGARLLGARSWGLIYDPLDGSSLEIRDKFITLAKKFGLTPLTEAASNAFGDRRALENLMDRGAQVMYLPPTASAERYGPMLLAAGRKKRIMVVSGHPEIQAEGAILKVTLDYHLLGEETAALARQILTGESPAHIPIKEKSPVQIDADESLLTYWSGYPPPIK